MVVRTGTDVAPRPGSSAILTPATALGGNDDRASASAVRLVLWLGDAESTVLLERHAGHTPARPTRRIVPTAPTPIATLSKRKPWDTSSCRINPTGKSGEAATATTIETIAAPIATIATRRSDSMTS